MHKTKIAVICICLFSLIFSTEVLPQIESNKTESKEEKSQRLLESLNKNFDEDQIDAAISNIEELLLLNPSDKDFIEMKSNLFYYRGAKFFEVGNYDKALQDLNISIVTNEKNANAFEARAKVFLFKEEFEKASADANKALELDPKSAHSNAILSGVYFSSEDFEKAIKSANIALKADKDDLLALEYRGTSYTALEKHKLALTDLDRVLEKDPVNLNALIHRMLSYSDLENWKATRNDANTILKLQDDFAPAFAMRGLANSALQENYELIISDLNMAEKLNSDLMSSDIYELRAMAHRQVGNTTAAERDEKKSNEMRLKEKEGNEP